MAPEPQQPNGPTMSDAPQTEPIRWKDGAQVAQVIEGMMASEMAAQAAAGHSAIAGGGAVQNGTRSGAQQKIPLGATRKGVQDARDLERAYDNAKTNLSNWRDRIETDSKVLPPVMRRMTQDWLDPQSGDQRAISGPLPPLEGRPGDPIHMPPQKGRPAEPRKEQKLEGRPAEPQQAEPEQLIPPEMKDWFETLEPVDQELAKELMIVMNRRGDDTGFPKLRPDRPDGTISDQALEEYGRAAEAFARKNIQEWIDILQSKGIL